MCLLYPRKVDEVLAKSGVLDLGFKVFTAVGGKICGVYFDHLTECAFFYKDCVWYTAYTPPLPNASYKVGFHYFLSFEDAYRYSKNLRYRFENAYRCSENMRYRMRNIPIRRVIVQNPYIFGYTADTTPTLPLSVVAEKMFILPPEVRL